ncbi:MAG: pyridoxal phosphate-dependent aminotransferase [Bacteriovoracaceae bacterium]
MIVKAHTKCFQDPYSPENPKGYLSMGIAENMIIEDLIEKKLSEENVSSSDYHHYNASFGILKARESFCDYLEEFFCAGSYDPENVVLASGATTILEILSYVLIDEGDSIGIHAPYYTGFEMDLALRFKGELVSFETENIEDLFTKASLTIEFLKEKKPKVFVLCHPHNPTGKCFNPEVLKEIIEFCHEQKIHLISDEVYAGTVLTKKEKFKSGFHFSKKSPYFHFVYSMAKDFALGGMKIGFLYTENPDVLKACRGVSYFSTPSTQSQLLMASLLSDEKWVSGLRQEVQKRLEKTFTKMRTKLLERHNFAYIVPEHGFFVFVDFTPLKKQLKIETDLDLFHYLIDEMKINILPANFFGLSERGYFRLCFARADDLLEEMFSRFDNVLK